MVGERGGRIKRKGVEERRERKERVDIIQLMFIKFPGKETNRSFHTPIIWL